LVLKKLKFFFVTKVPLKKTKGAIYTRGSFVTKVPLKKTKGAIYTRGSFMCGTEPP
jgi:hypothetical protein